MPFYDVECPRHGVHEIVRRIGEPLSCENAPRVSRHSVRRQRCFHAVEVRFSPESLPQARIDAGGEDATDVPQRVRDGTSQFNLGLPGVERVIGERSTGKVALEYRPITNHELGSNAGVREYAKRHGLIPMERGKYRPLGSR